MVYDWKELSSCQELSGQGHCFALCKKRNAIGCYFKFILWWRKKAVGRVGAGSLLSHEICVEITSSVCSSGLSLPSHVPLWSPAQPPFPLGTPLSSCFNPLAVSWLADTSGSRGKHVLELGKVRSGLREGGRASSCWGHSVWTRKLTELSVRKHKSQFQLSSDFRL